MDERELPGSGPAPEPGPARDAAGGLPGPGFGPDPEWDAYVAWREREVAAGRGEEPPEPWEVEGPAVSLGLGDAADVDPAILAAVCGPDGLDSEGVGPQFGQGAAADALRPGPLLAALAEQASAALPRLTDNQLAGALHAARRLENRAITCRRWRSRSSAAAATGSSRPRGRAAPGRAAGPGSSPASSWRRSCWSAGWRPGGCWSPPPASRPACRGRWRACPPA